MVHSETHKLEILSIYLLLLIYVLSVIWINFHSALWYQMDCYTYAYEGRLMYESSSFFPDNWIFGNQYHIISSPNLAALFYGITKNSISAMSLASSLSTILVLCSFIWCLSPFVKKNALWIGALCLGGGIIIGSNAAMYISGLQVLYTMCSYYACYLIGVLLSLGVWIRLRIKKKVPWGLIVLVVLLNFALGMQSLREMLILVIPLFLTEVLLCFFQDTRVPKAGVLFIGFLFLTELGGHYYMSSLDIASNPIIGELQLELHPNNVLSNFWASTKNILRISGLALANDGIHYLPLSICAGFIVLVILFSLIMIVKRKDRSPLAILIVFSTISIICVYGIGVFLMRTRDIYYFIYWLLASLSVVYLLNEESFQFRKFLVSSIILICSINYCFNFIPCFQDYHYNQKHLKAFSESLVERGISVIYVDDMPIFAASSQDRIISQSYWLDYQMQTGYPLTVFPSDKHTPIYDDAHYEHSLICISNYYRDAITNGPENFKCELMNNLELFDQITIRGELYSFYKPQKRIISPIF